MEIRIANIENIEAAAREFLRVIGNRRHIAFHGEMGAGKTTFISALCRVLEMEDEASSPTFSIVNEYRGPGVEGIDRISHFDFYRIESAEETLDLGLDDYFDSDALCLMEWPENVEDFLPEDTVDVKLSVEPTGERVINLDL
ncbi:MAG: tRNA (adenosine(37)-N6)-threonylcarbamoyltransferase complex ATPase subunit type 1 TsaE [Muribaculaceae bacterium]|nr:tRNA (adenosine(37)-N6)-threonylcarbamoyltransferase complex ATPase subunit type 1 TsaE [Muribaculaceae bacterium]